MIIALHPNALITPAVRAEIAASADSSPCCPTAMG